MNEKDNINTEISLIYFLVSHIFILFLNFTKLKRKYLKSVF